MDQRRIDKEKELKERIRKDFNKAAVHYDKYAFLQHEIALTLHASAAHHLKDGALVLDVGCGTGYQAERGAAKWKMIQCDIAEAMCERAIKFADAVTADAEQLPFLENSFDGVLSSLTLQWLSMEPALREMLRVLKPGGHLMVTTLGEQTLKELRQSFVAAVGVAPVMRFYTEEKLRSALKHSGFKVLDIESVLVVHEYKDIYTLLASIKGIGGRYKHGQGKAGISRRYFDALAEAYVKYFGAIDATWEVQYLLAEKV
jgi:malonyl-CoA O-methyltransferase